MPAVRMEISAHSIGTIGPRSVSQDSFPAKAEAHSFRTQNVRVTLRQLETKCQRMVKPVRKGLIGKTTCQILKAFGGLRRDSGLTYGFQMKQRLRIVVFSLSFAVIVSGCAQPIRPYNESHVETSRIIERNYDIGEQRTAFVGQAMKRVRKYYVERFSRGYMRASDDFVISGGIVTITGNDDTKYPIVGETTYKGVRYTVVSLEGFPPAPGFRALIGRDGSVHSKVLNYDIIMVYNFRLSPPDLVFSRSTSERIKVDSGYLNFELIYGGVDENAISILYREYTLDNPEKPVFFQELRYERGATNIRFRDTVIAIQEATNERIMFTVLSDGLESIDAD